VVLWSPGRFGIIRRGSAIIQKPAAASASAPVPARDDADGQMTRLGEVLCVAQRRRRQLLGCSQRACRQRWRSPAPRAFIMRGLRCYRGSARRSDRARWLDPGGCAVHLMPTIYLRPSLGVATPVATRGSGPPWVSPSKPSYASAMQHRRDLGELAGLFAGLGRHRDPAECLATACRLVFDITRHGGGWAAVTA